VTTVQAVTAPTMILQAHPAHQAPPDRPATPLVRPVLRAARAIHRRAKMKAEARREQVRPIKSSSTKDSDKKKSSTSGDQGDKLKDKLKEYLNKARERRKKQ